MSRNILKLSSVAVMLLVLSGCGGAEPEVKNAGVDFSCEQDGVLAPDFTCDPYAEGSITALGVAKMNAGNDKSFQRTEAMSSARDALARQIEVKVSNLFKNYIGTTGAGAESTYDKATSDVSKQLASQTLKGSKQIGRSWRQPETGELFILVGISSEVVEDGMQEAIKTSFKNDKALYQKFLAEKANGELSQELEKAGKE